VNKKIRFCFSRIVNRSVLYIDLQIVINYKKLPAACFLFPQTIATKGSQQIKGVD